MEDYTQFLLWFIVEATALVDSVSVTGNAYLDSKRQLAITNCGHKASMFNHHQHHTEHTETKDGLLQDERSKLVHFMRL